MLSKLVNMVSNILSGTNTATEGFKIPENWSWFKNDSRNIKKIGKKFSNQRLKLFLLLELLILFILSL